MTCIVVRAGLVFTWFLVVSSKHKPISDHIAVSVGDCSISSSYNVKNLGVLVDNHLTLVSHVNRTIQAAFLKLREMSYYWKFLTHEATKTLVHAYVTSRLDYCNGLLYGLPKGTLYRLQSVLNTAARLVTFTRKYDSISPVLKQLHWLPVMQRVKFKLLLLVFKSLNGLAPLYLRNKLIYKQKNGLRSDDQRLLVVPKSNLKSYGDRAFSVAGPKLSNSLPKTMRLCTSLDDFKDKLKTLLFKEAFYSNFLFLAYILYIISSFCFNFLPSLDFSVLNTFFC